MYKLNTKAKNAMSVETEILPRGVVEQKKEYSSLNITFITISS